MKIKMSIYGQLLDDLDFDKENVYFMICNYFDNPDMIKMKETDGMSVYMCKIATMLKNLNRYLIVIVPGDKNPVESSTKLKELKWVCFQSRSLEEYHNLRKHSYLPKREDPYNTKISVSKRDPYKSEYRSQKFNNINITLLHQKPNEFEYPNEGTISAALETFRTIITLE